jgi:hypothetical protein
MGSLSSNYIKWLGEQYAQRLSLLDLVVVVVVVVAVFLQRVWFVDVGSLRARRHARFARRVA